MHSGSSNQFGSYLRSTWLSPRRVRFWLLVLLILYTLLGFFALPWAVKSIAVNTVQDDFDRELQIESVRTNPFTLTLRIDELVLNDTDDVEMLSWDRLWVNFAWSSIFKQAWTFNTIQVDNPVVQEERFTSGETRFTRFAAEGSDNQQGEDDSAPTALQINELRIEGGVLRFTDNLDIEADNDTATPQQVALALEDIRLAVDDFALHQDTRSPARAEARLKDGGMLDFDGTLQMLPHFTLEGDISLDQLALIQATPYLQYFLGVELDSGSLSLSGQLRTGAEQMFAFQGAGDIRELRVGQGPDDETLIGWESLQAKQIDLDLNDSKLESGVIIIDGLTGQVVINEDQTTNFSELGDKPPAEAEANAEEQADNETDARTEDQEQRFPFTIAIEGVELANGAIHFEDNSLPLPFSTNIHSLNGEVSAISSTSSEPARLELEGQVEDYGLARAEGTLHTFQPMRSTQITLTFRNLEIPEYSPYTVDFAGRKIAGGTMDLDLEYTIDNEQLEGENKLVLRDLELGEQIDSEDAMNLPLNLAIALLEDSEGVIDLTLPVTGDVSNPEFDFNAIIREAIGQAFTSVVEAPFRFLASLVGADSEDLGQIEFAEGRTDLSPPQRQRVAELREALQQRPALTLELAGPFNRAFDAPAVKQEKALEILREQLAEAGREAEDPSLTSEANQALVERMFSSLYPDSEIESVQARFTEETDGSADETGFDALAYRNYLAEQVVAAQSVTDVELEAIGNARASAIRDALTDPDQGSGVSADRVRILPAIEVDSVESELIAMEVEVTTD